MIMIVDLSEAKKIANYFAKDPRLKDNIISIYIMGSFARGNYTNTCDLDLNIFIKNSSGKLMDLIAKRLTETSEYFKRDIDNNIITHTSYLDDQLNSDIFPQKNRHALFIYEIKKANALLYGEDILNNVTFSYKFLLPEALKLIQTQVYRLSKLLLAKKPPEKELKTQAIKYVLYSTQFYLIYRGYLIDMVSDFRPLFRKITCNELSDSEINFIENLYTKREKRDYEISYEEILHCYDVLENLALLSMNRFRILRNCYQLIVPKENKLVSERISALYKLKYQHRLNQQINIDYDDRKSDITIVSPYGNLIVGLSETTSQADYLVNNYQDLDLLFLYSRHLDENENCGKSFYQR